MSSQSKQNIVVGLLCRVHEEQGFVTKDKALELMDRYNISILETDRVVGLLLDRGVFFSIDQNADKDSEIDWSRTDYEAVFRKLLSLAPGLNMIVEYIRNTIPPQRHEWLNLLPQARAGNEYAAKRLFDMHLRLVAKQSLSFHKKHGYDLEALFQEGAMGLMQGIKSYDLARHGNIGSYLALWIRQHLKRSFDNQSCFIKLPVHFIGKLDRYMIAYRRIQERTGVKPRREDIAAEMRVDPDHIERIENTLYSFESLEDHLIESDDGHLEYQIIDPRFPSTDVIDERISRAEILREIDTLTPREATVLRLRFGFDDNIEHTLEEVGKIFRVTRERVRQIESKALKRLRLSSRSERLRCL